MVELKGTEKQIKWAEDIRKKFLSVANNLLNLTKTDDYKTWLNKRYDVTEETDLIELLENLKKNDSSKFWIENRYAFEDIQSEIEFTIELSQNLSSRIRGAVIKTIEKLKDLK